jgi:hypothetical protein
MILRLSRCRRRGAAFGEKPPWRGNEYYSFGVYQRGAGGVFDGQAMPTGFSLDDLMRSLYQMYGLKRIDIDHRAAQRIEPLTGG